MHVFGFTLTQDRLYFPRTFQRKRLREENNDTRKYFAIRARALMSMMCEIECVRDNLYRLHCFL